MFAQQLLDTSAPAGVRNYWRSEFMDAAPDEALQIMAEAGPKKGSPMSMVQLLNVGPSPEVDNAFPGRDHAFLYHAISVWEDEAEDEQHIGWNKKLGKDLEQYAAQSAYLNFIGDEGSDRVRRTFGAKYDRLVDLKRSYDPQNMFRYNQNIAP
jgi:FAD/FMN-containing dehydrogenase